ncbi:exosortase A [Rhodopila sp.]|uniref:exosortase A n=1 Tax=Rhodopila sp. TaxID=2480087 RepID=UPI003D1058A7
MKNQGIDAPVLTAEPPRGAASARRFRGTSAGRRIALPLCLGLLLLGAVFNQEVAAAVRTWIDSTAYNHCFLIIPIALFLLRERRSDLAGIAPRPIPVVALLAIPVALVWLVAERLGIMEGRQLAVVSFAELLFLAVLGRRLWWMASGPLLYLYFLVPFGGFLTPKLQDATTFFIRHGLDSLGVPAYIDGYIIEIPQGTFFVAEACAGLRFLIASVAFGCLYALMMYRSPVRRGVFIMVSIIVPIIANGFRGLGIVYLGYILGSAQAAAADHIIYGWIFFSAVILVLIMLGLPFREDDTPSPPNHVPPEQTTRSGSAFAAVAGVVVLAALAPMLTAGLTMAGSGRPAIPAALDIGSGCVILAGRSAGSDEARIRTERAICGNIAMDMTWEAFPPGITAGPVMAERRRLCRPAETENASKSWMPDTSAAHRAWRIMQSNEPAYVLATALWIDGKPARPGVAMRARMAVNSLFGTAYAPLLVTMTPAVSWDGMRPSDLKAAETSLLAFLQAHPDLDSRIAALSALR